MLVTPGFPASAAPMLWTIIVEGIGTFFLVFTVLQVAASKNGGKDFFGISIGFVVISMAFTLGGISGGAFNPAVGFLALLSNMSRGIAINTLLAYGCGPCGGALVAIMLYRITNADEFEYVLLGEEKALPGPVIAAAPKKTSPPKRK